MDCDLCGIRSSVAHCAACKKLLCETCGVTCAFCGKMLCPEHFEETHTGKRLCAACDEMRKRARVEEGRQPTELENKAKAITERGISALQSHFDAEAEANAPGNVEEVILGARAHRSVAPWKRSMHWAAAAALCLLVMWFFPSFRHLSRPWASCLAGLLCAISTLWSLIGLRDGQEARNRALNYLGLGISIILLVIAVWWAIPD